MSGSVSVWVSELFFKLVFKVSGAVGDLSVPRRPTLLCSLLGAVSGITLSEFKLWLTYLPTVNAWASFASLRLGFSICAIAMVFTWGHS